MKTRLTLATAALLVTALLGASAPKPTIQQALDAIAAQAPVDLATQGAPGMAIAITDRNHLLRIITVGYANVAAQERVTATTRFGIGSITKSMTSIALLELRDAGKFDPSLPVTAYLPWFKPIDPYRPITSYDLFTHTSGLPANGSIDKIDAVTVQWAPGTRWSYSNLGYHALGRILKSLSGTNDYDTIVHKSVLDPLGMTDSTPVYSPQTLATAATGYSGATHAAEDMSTYKDYQSPVGSMLSIPADMATYMRFLMNGGKTDDGRQLISHESWLLLTTPAHTDGHTLGEGGNGIEAAYGYGLGIHQRNGDTIVGHTGGVEPYTACMEMDMTTGYGIIAMTNIGYQAPRPCAIVNYALNQLNNAS
jgi:CubicO group peptidase (beta-lactamase class C family)